MVNLVILVMLSTLVKLMMISNQSRISLPSKGWVWMPEWFKSSHSVKLKLLEYNC